MELRWNQAGIDRLTEEIRAKAEASLNAGIQQASGQPLDQAVETVAHAMSAAGVDPNRSGIRDKLVELGWE